MITLTAKIDFQKNGGELTSLSCNNSGSQSINNVLNQQNMGALSYFVGSKKSTNYKMFTTPYKITVKSSSLSSFFMVFDLVNKTHPRTVKIVSREIAGKTAACNYYRNEQNSFEKIDIEHGELHPNIPFRLYFENSIPPTSDNNNPYNFNDIRMGIPKEDGTLLNLMWDRNTGYGAIILHDYIKQENFIIVEGELDTQYIFDYYGIYTTVDEDGINITGYFVDEGYNIIPEPVVYFTKYDEYNGVPQPNIVGDTIIIFYQEPKQGETLRTYTCRSPYLYIDDLPSETENLFVIDNWNTANAPFILGSVYIKEKIDINRNNLISMSSQIADRSDFKLPSFGIISNVGNLEFNDQFGEIQFYAEELLLQSGLTCEIFLNNTLVDGKSEKIGNFETDQWDYDNDNRSVSVSLKDDLEEWQDINVEAVSYDARNPQEKPLMWVYEHLWKLTSNRNSYVNANGEIITASGNYNMLSFYELDEDTQTVLNETYMQYPLLESGSLWQQWTKLCQVCQLHIYKENDGVIVCRYNGGN